MIQRSFAAFCWFSTPIKTELLLTLKFLLIATGVLPFIRCPVINRIFTFKLMPLETFQILRTKIQKWYMYLSIPFFSKYHIWVLYVEI